MESIKIIDIYLLSVTELLPWNDTKKKETKNFLHW